MGWRFARGIMLTSGHHTLECHSLTQPCRWWVLQGCLLAVNIFCAVSIFDSKQAKHSMWYLLTDFILAFLLELLVSAAVQKLIHGVSEWIQKAITSILCPHRMIILPWKLGGSQSHSRTRYTPLLLECPAILLSFMPHRYSKYMNYFHVIPFKWSITH